MNAFTLRISAFSICWLRCYDFGLELDDWRKALSGLHKHPLVLSLSHINEATEIDTIDRDLFDIRYQEHSELMRIYLRPFEVVDQDVGTRRMTAPVSVSLLLDKGSGFGVFNLCLPQPDVPASHPFTVEEIGFLTRQWLLARDASGQSVRLNIHTPIFDRVAPFYIREVMNLYFLQLHNALWEAVAPGCWPSLQDWYTASQEEDPRGCESIRELKRQKLVRSLFPTSFGSVLDIWGIEGADPAAFDAESFCKHYESDIAWLFTDGRDTSLGNRIAHLRNEELTHSRALFLWPNHAIYINQDIEFSSSQRGLSRLAQHGHLEVEVVRLLEILNLHSALIHAFDRALDEQLEQVSSLTARDRLAVIKITQQRRDISRSIRSFDFYNLFHTAHWEPLFVRLLESPSLNFQAATELVEAKLQRFDDEIQQTILVQDRVRQQQQREQELDVLRGLHGLSLANDIQSNALMIINFVVSATASFGFTEVISPWLDSLTGAQPSFQKAYPAAWIALNVGVFVIITLVLASISSLLIRRKSRVVEVEGFLHMPYDRTELQSYVAHYGKALEYYHWNSGTNSGYLRIRKPHGTLLLEFDGEHFHRFILFLQSSHLAKPDSLKEAYIDEEIWFLRKQWLTNRAKRVLAENDLGRSTKPAPNLYPHQWNWDSAFIAIGLARYDPIRAGDEICSLLRGQWRNGMIPHIIYDPNASGYFPDAPRWQISRSPDAPPAVITSGITQPAVITSGITQPPMITIAVWAIVRRSKDKHFAREAYPRLLEYHRWFHRKRDPYHEGLVSIVHPWESGLDNSPRWADILNRIELTVRPRYERQDIAHVPLSQRPSDEDYDRLVYLMDLARDLNYDQQQILAHSPFVVQDILVNSILYRADDCLRELARTIGQPTREIDLWMEKTRNAVQSKLWDDTDALYYDYDVRNTCLIRENTIASFMPLYAGLADDHRARQLVEKHLLNPLHYTPDSITARFRVSTTSRTNRYFDALRYWRGPIWLNTNWLVIRGLERYGYSDLARHIRADTYALVERAGFCEYFDPRTGTGYGTDAFSWSAALTIDLLEDEP